MYIPDMEPGYRFDTQPRLPAIEILTASIEDLHYWNWDQAGMPYWRLYWNDARGASITWEKRVELDSDHLYLVAPHTPTRLRLDGNVGHLFVHFVVSPPFHQPRHCVWTFPLGSRQRRQMHTLHDLIVQPGPPPQISLELLAIISRHLALIPASGWDRRPMDKRVHHATMLIEQGIGHSLTVEALATEVGMSTAAFARLFRATIGISPYSYILRRRAEIAAVRLGTTDAPIEQIASVCGFCDRYHFTRVFTHQFGIAPGHFRRHRHVGSRA